MFEIFKKNKIVHLASMARSGETLMLKILAVHPDIEIVHNLDKEDNPNNGKAFLFLKTYKEKTIARNHSVVKHYGLVKNKILLLKQGVWKHDYPFDGFILSRNPVSIYASLKTYDKDLPEYDKQNNFWFKSEERLLSWLKGIDKEAIDLMKDKNPLEQFCFFYNLRMSQLLETQLPIIRYEDLILNTKDTLEKVCSILKLKMDKRLLNSHDYYDSGVEGHGKNVLSKPIDTSSLLKYKENITEEEFNYISENTLDIHKQFGYKLVDFKITLF